MVGPTVAEIKARLDAADEQTFAALERSFKGDTRKGVQQCLDHTRKRLERQAAERARVQELYDYERSIAQGGICVGLDEVGRGPLAGPLTVGAVVFPATARPIDGLNDSKQVNPELRAQLSEQIKQQAQAWSIVHVPPEDIDSFGITACLKQAFTQAIANIEAQGVSVDCVLLDGNPLHIDAREHAIVKGDAHCASIAAASIIAKVARDARMVAYDEQYPGYDFASSKGYGSARHREAIAKLGLSPIHRKSFCAGIFQESLF